MALSQAESTPLQSHEYTRLTKLLSRARSRYRFLILTGAAVRTAVIVLGGLAVLFALDNLFHLPWLIRLSLTAILPLGATYYFYRRSREAFGRWLDDRVAVRLEEACPELHNQLINAVQLGREPSAANVTRLIQKIVADAAERGTRMQLKRVVPMRDLRRWGIVLAVGLAVLVVYGLALPGHFRNAAARFFRPAASVLPMTQIVLSVQPGNTLVARGTALDIKATPKDAIPDKATVCFREKGQTTALDMVFDGSIFVHSIGEVQGAMKYQIRADDFRSHWYSIKVAERPEVTRFRLTYTYPEYARLAPKEMVSSQGHIRAVMGTTVDVEAWTDRPVEKVEVFDAKDRPIEASVEKGVRPPGGDRDTSRVQFKIPVNGDDAYRVVAYDEQEFTNEPAPVYTVKAVPDLRPSVLVRSPRESVDVPQGRDIPVHYVASDDYGILSLKGVIQREDGTDRQYIEDRTFSTPTLRLEDAFQLPLAKYKVGDELLLSLIASDANPIARGVTRSDSVRIRIVDPKNVAESELERFDAMEGKLAEGRDSESLATESVTTLIDDRLTTKSDLAEKFKKLHDDLEEFLEVQKRVIKTTEDLAKIPADELSEEQLGELKDVANLEDDWAKYFKEASTDLSRVPETEAVDSALCAELNEIYSEIQKVADELTPKNIEIYVPVEQAGAELAETLSNRMEEWLSDTKDHVKWDMEEPPAPLDVPLAELPEELEDLMGDLIEQEEDMTEDIEDVSSSWADSMSDAGWDAMDGPISNFSAVGKTGNMMPNDTEISGRSGEGRTGKSHGEFVEQTATGKGGRKTPTRLTPDQFETGVVQDKSTDGVGGSTGGGKRAGFGGRGLTGPTPPVTQDQGVRLAGKQADIREKAQQLEGLLKRYSLPTAKLDSAIGRMGEIEQMARAGRYDSMAAVHKVKLEDLRENDRFVRGRILLNQERRDAIPQRVRHQITQGLQEKFPEGYEDLLKTYYEVLSGM